MIKKYDLVCKFCDQGGFTWGRCLDTGRYYLEDRDGKNHTEECKRRNRNRYGSYNAGVVKPRERLEYEERTRSAPVGPFSEEYVPGEGKDTLKASTDVIALTRDVPRSGKTIEVAFLTDDELATLLRKCTAEISKRLKRS